ncbi:hypothetical protein [Hyalangium versicolor]|uniref:hypothetical protein n=1 Tax=Hyalangium versicolor TaxID=2861190 RepID=UPI001CC985EB|nr:hypothetical protein [Hyalangium versicolor]
MRAPALGLMLVALLGAGEASAQRLPFTWDVPKVLEVVEVPGVLKADGVPVKIRSVKSAERPEVILQHMVDRFEQWGFYIPPDHHRTQVTREPQLTALDTERFISYTFALQPNPDGTTTVVLGEANLSRPRQTGSPIAPVFPGAKGVVNSDLEVARSLTYVISAPRGKVETFYREEMRKAGYTEREPFLFRNGGDELQVMVRDSKDGQVSVVVLRRTVPSSEEPPDAD